ncbi:hypothetical protein niasHT_001555 [Heterodera trifolii]|uniref:C2H2-type domain-containing protein n=1 Tax=Heterodera trifolii TaxID=157864 RepID=A0ABD2MB11_9BILA
MNFACATNAQNGQSSSNPAQNGQSSSNPAQNGQSSPSPDVHSNLWIVSDGFGKVSYICLWAGCQERIEHSDQLKAHLNQHMFEFGPEPLTEIVCQVRGCRILVSSLDELVRHMKMHLFHAERMLNGASVVEGRCPQLLSCNFEKSSRLVYQGDPLLCEWNSCLQSFTDINDFMGHVELHVQSLSVVDRSGDGFYECLWNDCQASFENKAHLLRHVHHHSGDKMCACPFCGAFFAHSAGLIKHVVRRQNVDASLVCRFCQKAFPNDALLKKHCVRHLKTRQCQFCSLVLASPYDLNRHIETVHAKMRCHCCEYCDKTWAIHSLAEKWR